MTRLERSRLVAALLDEDEEVRRRLYVAQTYGVQPAGLRDLKSELREAQRRLAEL